MSLCLLGCQCWFCSGNVILGSSGCILMGFGLWVWCPTSDLEDQGTILSENLLRSCLHGCPYQHPGCHQYSVQVQWCFITLQICAFNKVHVSSRRYLFLACANNGNVCFVEWLLHLGQHWWKVWVLSTEAVDGNGRLHSGETAAAVCCFVSCFASGKCGFSASQVCLSPRWGSGSTEPRGSPPHLWITTSQAGDTSPSSNSKAGQSIWRDTRDQLQAAWSE